MSETLSPPVPFGTTHTQKNCVLTAGKPQSRLFTDWFVYIQISIQVGHVQPLHKHWTEQPLDNYNLSPSTKLASGSVLVSQMKSM